MNKDNGQKTGKKARREQEVLIGLIDHFLEMGKPIGSNTLKEHGFDHMSSATIRNYFADLEKQGLLTQPHSSGGRIPTNEAFRLYAREARDKKRLLPEVEKKLRTIGQSESGELMRFLQQSAETLSEVTGYATFLSSVRFDHDFILEVKLVSIDETRTLCVMVTDFGQVLTEILPTNGRLSSFAIKRIEDFIQWKLKGGVEPAALEDAEEKLAIEFYNEMMVRYLVRYSNFSDEDVFRTGFSQLLSYPEFNDPVALTTGLSLFENTSHMRLLLNDCVRSGELCQWIGEDLAPYASAAQGCSVLAIPYHIGQASAGAVGLLGPCRMPYRQLFGTLDYFSEKLSQALTKSLYKHQLSFRQPRAATPYLQNEERALAHQTKLIENKDQK